MPLLRNPLIYLTLAVTAVTQGNERLSEVPFEMFPHQVAITSSTGLNSL